MELRTVTDKEEVATYLAKQIAMQLSMGMHVLWFVPGGSAVAIAVAVAQKLSTAGAHLENLTVTLTDERYGPVGHADSNFAALEAAGFSLPDATIFPVLTGASREETTHVFDEQLAKAFAESDYAIGLFGIGSDGHTAGVLPHSPAVESEALVCAYDAKTYERITMTPRAIGMLNDAVAYAVGEDKWPALGELLGSSLSVTDQPAQILKQVPHAVLYSDYRS